MRSHRLMAMFGADWRDPNRYDLILNMAKMTREGAKLVAHLPLSDASSAFVVWRHTEFTMPNAPAHRSARRLFKGRTESDLLEANRAVLFGTNDSGGFTLTEVKVSVHRKA